jgi:GMP synthase PP-ATPase subunit
MGHYRTSGAIGDQLSCIFVDHRLTRWVSTR